MIKIFINQVLSEVRHVPLLIPNLGPIKFGNELFRSDAFKGFSEPIVSLVKKVEECDFILLPHNYQQVKNIQWFLSAYIELARKSNKPIIIFAYGDVDEKISIPKSVVLKYSMYKKGQRLNEVKMPAYTEDLLVGSEIKIKEKSGVPTIGFCGWARYKNYPDATKAFLKNLYIDFLKIIKNDKSLEVRKRGVYFRKKVTNILKKSDNIRANFIIRTSHSANKKTIGLSSETARDEYVKNIKNSDMSLAIRGDANESMRLYEILSLGRIPILIDTDCVLPLEDIIDYDQFILRINYKDMNMAADMIAEFYNKMSGEDFIKKQVMARQVFDKYLNPEAFLRTVFSNPQILYKHILL